MLRAKDRAAEPGWDCALISSDFGSTEVSIFRVLVEAIGDRRKIGGHAAIAIGG